MTGSSGFDVEPEALSLFGDSSFALSLDLGGVADSLPSANVPDSAFGEVPESAGALGAYRETLATTSDAVRESSTDAAEISLGATTSGTEYGIGDDGAASGFNLRTEF
jgi:hypothetical protein